MGEGEAPAAGGRVRPWVGGEVQRVEVDGEVQGLHQGGHGPHVVKVGVGEEDGPGGEARSLEEGQELFRLIPGVNEDRALPRLHQVGFFLQGA